MRKSGEFMPKTSAVPPSAMEYAMKLLSKRAYAESEVRMKLRKKNYSPEEIEHAVSECIRYSFINDRLYALDYAALLNSRGCGSLMIRRKLSLLRIADEFIEEALQAVAASEIAAAANALDFKLRMLKGEKDPFKKRRKLIAFMLSRGYSFDIIRVVMDNANIQHEEENYNE